MTFIQFICEIGNLRKEQLSKELDGNISKYFDEENMTFKFYGHCNKVHPDVKETYPNGWEMGTTETIDEVLQKLNFTIELGGAK